MPEREPAEKAFIRAHATASDPASPIWTTQIPETWKNGYLAGAKDNATVAVAAGNRLLDLAEAQSVRLQGELDDVDAVLRRRDALEPIEGRVQNIIHTINTAAQVDPLTKKLELSEAAYTSQLTTLRAAERALSDSYLRIRKMVGDMHRAPHGSEGVDAMYVFTETELAEQLAERDRLASLLGDNKSTEAALLAMQKQRDEWHDVYTRERKLREEEFAKGAKHASELNEDRERLKADLEALRKDRDSWHRSSLLQHANAAHLESVLEDRFGCTIINRPDSTVYVGPSEEAPTQAMAGEPNPDYVAPKSEAMSIDPGFYQEQQSVERELAMLRLSSERMRRRLLDVEERYHNLLEENHIRGLAMKNPSQVSPSDLPSPGVRP